MSYYQQGDVLIFKAEGIKKNEMKKVSAKARGFVLAEGEATGHAHTIATEEGVEMFEKDGQLFLTTDHEVTVKHEEHGNITIPAGDYRIGIVKEYDHFEEEAREVRD